MITVEKKSNTGVVYHAAQLVLHSSERLHHPHTRVKITGLPCLPNGELSGKAREELPGYLVEVWEKTGRPSFLDATNPYRYIHEEVFTEDDDRSAVTFWLPRSKHRREEMAKAFERIAEIFRNAPPESGLD